MTDTTLIRNDIECLILKLVDMGVFEIDDERGEVWRIAVLKQGELTPCDRRRAEEPSPNGYLRIRVMYQGVRFRASAHRVIYRYVHGGIPDDCVVDHENEVRKDNRIGNLEAVTQSVNVRRALRTEVA